MISRPNPYSTPVRCVLGDYDFKNAFSFTPRMAHGSYKLLLL